ncbi:hypothetical protein, partial [Kingella kingae]|uniref:hypothetical protein n=1 Tax=Kingella kingae TaxID=504 RepID=UPI001EE1E61C
LCFVRTPPSTYDNATSKVLTSEKGVGALDLDDLGGAVDAFTQFAFLFTERPHTAKVDALELEILSLPAAGFGDSDVLFVRRFEMDGMQV